MSSESRRLNLARKKEGKRLQTLPWNEFIDVTREALHSDVAKTCDPSSVFDFVYRNNKYIVFLKFGTYRPDGHRYTRVMCRRNDSKPIYSWNDLYRIKNEIFGHEVEAVQIMPRVSELVDQANLYWFWIREFLLDGKGKETDVLEEVIKELDEKGILV